MVKKIRKSSAKKDRSLFLKIFKECNGNVSAACESFGCERRTFYYWCEKYEEFRKAADEVREERIDFIENALDKRIKAGDTTAIIFALKTIGKDRGYVERVEQKVSIEREQPLFGDDFGE